MKEAKGVSSSVNNGVLKTTETNKSIKTVALIPILDVAKPKQDPVEVWCTLKQLRNRPLENK